MQTTTKKRQTLNSIISETDSRWLSDLYFLFFFCLATVENFERKNTTGKKHQRNNCKSHIFVCAMNAIKLKPDVDRKVMCTFYDDIWLSYPFRYLMWNYEPIRTISGKKRMKTNERTRERKSNTHTHERNQTHWETWIACACAFALVLYERFWPVLALVCYLVLLSVDTVIAFTISFSSFYMFFFSALALFRYFFFFLFFHINLVFILHRVCVCFFFSLVFFLFVCFFWSLLWPEVCTMNQNLGTSAYGTCTNS